MRDRFGGFSEGARRVLTTAEEEAKHLNHSYVGTEHILLGLIQGTDGIAARVLSNLGVELSKVRSAVEFIIGRGEHPPAGEIGLTPRAKRVIELAVDEAQKLNHRYTGTEHLLIGLLRVGEGVAAGVLESLGVNLEGAREQVMQTQRATDDTVSEPYKLRWTNPQGRQGGMALSPEQPLSHVLKRNATRKKALAGWRWWLEYQSPSP